MSTSQHRPPQPDAFSLIEQEIRSAESDRRPMSRQMLAEFVNQKTGVTVSDAFALVDQYCDENAPAVPHYLQEEFAIPYLKVIAVLNIVVAGGLYYWGITVFKRGLPAWPWFFAGTIFLGFASLAWVKSLERYAERKRLKA